MYEWLVALNVDDYIPVTAYFACGLFYPVGSAFVVGTCHDGLSAERLHGFEYALVVGGYVGIAQRLTYFSINMFYNVFPSKHGKRLARET